MDDKLKDAEPSTRENDALGAGETDGATGGENSANTSADGEPVSAADPPIIIQGGGIGG